MTALYDSRQCVANHFCYGDQSNCEFVVPYNKMVLAVEELKQWIPFMYEYPDFVCHECHKSSKLLYERNDEQLCQDCLYREVFGDVS